MAEQGIVTSDYARPLGLSEALQLRADHPAWTPLAGGTDLMVAPGLERLDGILDLSSVAELVGIESREEGGQTYIRIGAGTTFAQIMADSSLAAHAPMLQDAASEIGAWQIQNRASLGGNIATSSPVGDSLPVLLALDAEIELAKSSGTRRIPYHEFCTGYRQTAMAADELLSAIWLPCPAEARLGYWRKVGTRQAQSISKLSVAASVHLDGGMMRDVRFAMGAVADRPIRLAAVESLLEGQKPDAALAEKAAESVAKTIQPISDIRSTASYRLHAGSRLAARFVLWLLEQAR